MAQLAKMSCMLQLVVLHYYSVWAFIVHHNVAYFQKHGILALMKRPPEGTDIPFESYSDLIYQSEYVYGTIERSTADRFFSVSLAKCLDLEVVIFKGHCCTFFLLFNEL